MPSNIPRYLQPTLHYSWVIDKAFLEHGGTYSFSGSNRHMLTLTGVQLSDDRTVYRCTAQESGSRYKSSAEETLRVRLPPRLVRVVPSGTISRTEGDRLTLTCSASCAPPCTFRWITRSRVIGSESVLHIPSLGRDDSGVYQCKADNKVPPAGTSTVTVNVNYPPAISLQRSPSSGDLHEGMKLTLICIVDSRPNPTSISWQNVTLPGLPPLGCSYRNESQCHLTLPRLDILHSGSYRCLADNGIGPPVGYETHITVYGPARWYKLEPADRVREVSIGNTTYFKVWVVANPLPQQNQWRWKFLPSAISNVENSNIRPERVHLAVFGATAVLTVTNVSRDHYGEYAVWTRNQIGGWDESKLKFKLIPISSLLLIVTQVPSGELMVGSQVTLTCTAIGEPSPLVLGWRKLPESRTPSLHGQPVGKKQSVLTLFRLDFNDSGTYQCLAYNGASKSHSPATANKTIEVYGPPKWYKIDPTDRLRTADIGASTDFRVWIVGRPLPRPDQWHWSFAPSNVFDVITKEPADVELSVSGDTGELDIRNVTKTHYGTYYIFARNKYGGWPEKDLAFRLETPLTRLLPLPEKFNYSIGNVLPRSFEVRVQAGSPQSITIIYTDVVTGVVRKITDLPYPADGVEGETYNVTDGVQPGREYRVLITAVDEHGETGASEQLFVITPAPITYNKLPVVTILGERAELHFLFIGSVTHINVTNCVRATTNCLAAIVIVPPTRRQKRDTSGAVHDFRQEVELVEPDARMWTFYFWKYYHDTLITPKPEVVDVDLCACEIIPIALLAAFIAALILTILAALLMAICCRRKKTYPKETYRKRVIVTKDDVGMYASPKTTQLLFKIGDIAPGPHVIACPFDVSYIITSGVDRQTLIADDNYYKVWRGTFVDKDNVRHDVAIKEDKGCNEGYGRYLIRQAEMLIKLRNHNYIIPCLGMTSDCRLLVMEFAPLGNLKQYLQARASGDPSDMSCSPSFQLNIVYQIMDGFESVQRLYPPCLFYCLSASNVLMTGDEKCKLSGFASASIVRRREEWEEKNNLPRPVQWLSPEAIRLEHVSKSDVWSLGVIMWQVFSDGRDPFDRVASVEIKQKILHGQKLSKPVKCSSDVFDTMALCWMQERSNRPSIEYIRNSLRQLHPQD